MADLQLWRVKVTHVKETSGTAMVWAESQRQALQMAEDEVDLDDVIDSDVDYTTSTARTAPMSDLDLIKPGNEWLVMPDGSGTDDIEEFRSVLTPDMQFVLQQREWERNGQMSLEVRA